MFSFTKIRPVTPYIVIYNRVVYPDEVEEAKEAAAKAVDNKGGDSNDVEEPPPAVTVATRNMIVAPPNCPPGQQMGSDGVCRPVWK
ncbi:hypothetical protein ABMA27_014111 [Loxostege sticticalis]|uniref:Uncharacterized protein n=1 Tax=Loxostege sticticalis TaxID=481309 RepID=A0ABR3ICR8_LOXSC